MNQTTDRQQEVGGTTLSFKVEFATGYKGSKRLQSGVTPAINSVPVGRTPRVSKLMALAIKMDQLVRSGVVKDYAELARLGHVTRARLSQIMNLMNLAPDIIESVLHLPSTRNGRDAVAEHHLRVVAKSADWRIQRETWEKCTNSP